MQIIYVYSFNQNKSNQNQNFFQTIVRNLYTSTQ